MGGRLCPTPATEPCAPPTGPPPPVPRHWAGAPFPHQHPPGRPPSDIHRAPSLPHPPPPCWSPACYSFRGGRKAPRAQSFEPICFLGRRRPLFVLVTWAAPAGGTLPCFGRFFTPAVVALLSSSQLVTPGTSGKCILAGVGGGGGCHRPPPPRGWGSRTPPSTLSSPIFPCSILLDPLVRFSLVKVNFFSFMVCSEKLQTYWSVLYPGKVRNDPVWVPSHTLEFPITYLAHFS